MNFLIVDDHAIVRKGMIELLKEEFSGNFYGASCLGETIDFINKYTFDLIILDISMEGRNGLEILKQLKEIGIKAPILMLSMHSEDIYAIRCLKAGASGFVNKISATEELIVAAHKLLKGKKYFSENVTDKLLVSKNDHSKLDLEILSDREIQVLQKIAGGKSISDIALELNLSVNTISTYRSRVLEKLNLKNNSEITRFVFENGLENN